MGNEQNKNKDVDQLIDNLLRKQRVCSTKDFTDKAMKAIQKGK